MAQFGEVSAINMQGEFVGREKGIDSVVIVAKAEQIKIIQFSKYKIKRHGFMARKAPLGSRLVARRPIRTQGGSTHVPALPQGWFCLLGIQPLTHFQLQCLVLSICSSSRNESPCLATTINKIILITQCFPVREDLTRPEHLKQMKQTNKSG